MGAAFPDRTPLHHPAVPDGPPPQRAGEDFSASAVRLSGFCAVVLGWVPEVFWGATPAEVGAVASVLSPPTAAPVDGALLRALRERLDE